MALVSLLNPFVFFPARYVGGDLKLLCEEAKEAAHRYFVCCNYKLRSGDDGMMSVPACTRADFFNKGEGLLFCVTCSFKVCFPAWP